MKLRLALASAAHPSSSRTIEASQAAEPLVFERDPGEELVAARALTHVSRGGLHHDRVLLLP